MKRIILIVLVMFVASACAKETFFHQISGSARLKDKKTVHYNLDVYFKTATGVTELKKKEKLINHAIRIILAQRGEKQLSNAGRLKTIVKKVLSSQLKSKATSIRVNSFNLD